MTLRRHFIILGNFKTHKTHWSKLRPTYLELFSDDSVPHGRRDSSGEFSGVEMILYIALWLLTGGEPC